MTTFLYISLHFIFYMKIGLIGCGNISRSHLNNYIGMGLRDDLIRKKKTFQLNETADNEIVAISDLYGEKVNKTHQEYLKAGHKILHKFSGKNSHKQLLELNLDAVSICVPPIEDKVEIVIDSLKAGKNILVEKPLSYDSKSAFRIAEAVGGNVAAMCYNLRNTYLIEKFKELIETEKFGKLNCLSVFRAEKYNYFNSDSFYFKLGYLFEHNCHDINYLRFLNGEIESLEAIGYGDIPRNPSSWTMKFQYQNGANGEFHSMNGTRTPMTKVVASFDQGIVMGITSKYNPDLAWKDVPYYRILGPEGEIFAKESANKKSLLDIGYQGVNARIGHNRIIEDFLSSIGTGLEPRSTLVDGYKDIKVLEAIIGSLENNGKRVLVR